MFSFVANLVEKFWMIAFGVVTAARNGSPVDGVNC